jgi:hypothetical protein
LEDKENKLDILQKIKEGDDYTVRSLPWSMNGVVVNLKHNISGNST